jgi:hypothetical protein
MLGAIDVCLEMNISDDVSTEEPPIKIMKTEIIEEEGTSIYTNPIEKDVSEEVGISYTPTQQRKASQMRCVMVYDIGDLILII